MQTDSTRVSAWAVPGVPEVAAGDDLALLIGDAIDALPPADALVDGDIVVVTSKIVSKAEGRAVAADDREDAITRETVRVVATRAYDGGVTRIVQNRLGIVGAAAGVDASNVTEGTVLLLPLDPDASARALCTALRLRFGVRVGVLISDTLGRAWRIGQTDVAIGAGGVRVVDDLRGSTDAGGRPLGVTQTVVADEICALTDLVKGKALGLPVAVVRGMSRFVAELDEPGAATLPRTGPTDMFRLGTDEAIAEGYARGFADGRRVVDARGDSADGAGAGASWSVVIPFKGAPGSKSRLANAFDDDRRAALAVAFLVDTVTAVLGVARVREVLVVTGDADAAASVSRVAADWAAAAGGDRTAGVRIVPDPGDGLNAAMTAGWRVAAGEHPERFVALMTGDLPELDPDDLDLALAIAEQHQLAAVIDHSGVGTTTLTVAPGVEPHPRFGADSARMHAHVGHRPIELAAESTLRLDVDSADDVERVRAGGRAGRATLAAVGVPG